MRASTRLASGAPSSECCPAIGRGAEVAMATPPPSRRTRGGQRGRSRGRGDGLRATPRPRRSLRRGTDRSSRATDAPNSPVASLSARRSFSTSIQSPFRRRKTWAAPESAAPMRGHDDRKLRRRSHPHTRRKPLPRLLVSLAADREARDPDAPRAVEILDWRLDPNDFAHHGDVHPREVAKRAELPGRVEDRASRAPPSVKRVANHEQS